MQVRQKDLLPVGNAICFILSHAARGPKEFLCAVWIHILQVSFLGLFFFTTFRRFLFLLSLPTLQPLIHYGDWTKEWLHWAGQYVSL